MYVLIFVIRATQTLQLDLTSSLSLILSTLTTHLGAKDEGEDSCQGDSGGPLVYKTPLGWHIQIGGKLFFCWAVACDDYHLLL